jgi:5-methyltetrahydrofolate--homocysteine methyltransferase
MSDPARRCLYDPLTSFMQHFSEGGVAAERPVASEDLDVASRLKRRIIDGDRPGLETDLEEALGTSSALDIVNSILLDGMKTVGDLFGAGQMQLPFVLQAAETMKAAVSYLEPFMDRVDGLHKGTIVLATVKGDVHDIGKNLVDIILTNNGYRVINLGIKVAVESLIHAAEEHRADALGMSGLLVKSTLVMKENLGIMLRRGIELPVILGGAALTRRFVEEDLRSEYRGRVLYARDAFDGLRHMESIMLQERGIPKAAVEGGSSAQGTSGNPPEDPAFGGASIPAGLVVERDGTAEGGASLDTAVHLQSIQHMQADRRPVLADNAGRGPAFRLRSAVRRDVPVPTPPFLGSIVMDDIPLPNVFSFINEAALIRGQWQIRRGRRTNEEYERFMAQEIRPILEDVKRRASEGGFLKPAVVYGYFPCTADDDDLIIYRPRNLEAGALHAIWPEKRYDRADLTEWCRFSFPRQAGDRYLCIADYFRPSEDPAVDVCAFHLVTMGAEASTHTAMLFAEGRYKEYLYMHGLAVECAEALAELWHKRIRVELGIAGGDASEIKRLFSQGYQGSRFSFGYPACPHLEDQAQLFDILQPERIGVTLTDEYQLVPEQSTSAIIVHHPEAKYFSIK